MENYGFWDGNHLVNIIETEFSRRVYSSEERDVFSPIAMAFV